MKETVYFQEVLPQICFFIGFAAVVMLIFLIYELVWRRKHPAVSAGRGSAREKKSVERRLFFAFVFLFLWILAFVSFLLSLVEAAVFMYLPVVLICVCGVCLCLASFKK